MGLVTNMYAQLYQLTIESNKLPVMFTRHNQPGYATAQVQQGHMSKRLLPGRELPLAAIAYCRASSGTVNHG